MKRQRPKLPNHDSSRTFHYNTRSSTRKRLSKTDIVEESAPLRIKKSKKISDDQTTLSDVHLPIDLVVEILKRLPVKTLARFLCVSKVWGSIIRSRDFKKLFLNESSNRPSRLFFSFAWYNHNCFLFSSNETPNPGKATYHLTHPLDGNERNSSSCVHDLICHRTDSPTELVVYNSTTKRSITLPKFELAGSMFFRHFLGYYPIDAVYKVLCMCKTAPRAVFKVLTLGNGNQWREIENAYTHRTFNCQICTNGVIYSDAYKSRRSRQMDVMSFDVRSEKFHLIKGPGDADFPLKSFLNMTMYQGKLAIISCEIPTDGSLVLWVLEDSVKQLWLKKIFVLPTSWTSLAQNELHHFLKITIAGEFILSPLKVRVPPFYVLYYDPKRNSMRKVPIEGILEHKPWFLYHLFSTELESLMFW